MNNNTTIIPANWQKTFKILWIGQIVSVFTSSIVSMAIIWYLIDTTKSAAIVSLATLAAFLPQAIIGYFAGTIVDRFKKVRVMIFSDLFIAFFTALLVVAGIFNLLSIPVIFFVLFMRSIGAAFHTPALHSLTPLIVPGNKLVQYAGHSKSLESMADLICPAVAAVLYSMFNLNAIIIFDVFGAIFAVFMLKFIKVDDTQRGQDYLFKDEFKKGIVYIKKDRGLIRLIIISGLYAMLYFPIGNLFPFIAISHFKVGISGSAIVETIFAIGTLTGSLLLSYWGWKLKKITAISSSIAIYGTSLVIMGLISANHYLIFYLLALVMGVSIPFYGGIQIAIIQLRVDREYLGRILSLVSSFSKVLMPFGLILSSLFAERVGINNWYAVSGVLAIMIAVYTFTNKILRESCDI